MLKVSKISKIFNPGSINAKLALNSVSLRIQEGDFVTVIGGNGSGKSTLLNCIAGVYSVEKGSIFIDSIDVTKLSEPRRAAMIGRVFQDPMMGTAAHMGIEENLAIAYRRGERRSLSWGISHDERNKYRELLQTLELGLEDRLSTKVGLLSGGQRQALTLLMATVKKPRILLLDEHTAALDPKTAQRVLEMSDQVIKEHKLTAMMVTHNMRDAIKYGNRLIMMHEGKIILDIKGEQKSSLKVEDLLKLFSNVSGEDFQDSEVLLS